MSPRAFFIIILPLAILAIVALPFVGNGSIGPDVLWQFGKSDIDSLIFWQIRLPRVLLAFLAGTGLALGGLVFQSIFRNPLATPFTLGVAGGASLGVTLWIFFGLQLTIFGISGISLAALTGAILSIALVYGIARATGNLAPNTMLLGGVAISFFFSSIILLLQYLGEISDTFRIIHWLMGDLSRANYDMVLQVFPFIATGTLITCVHSRDLNLLTLDDDLAATRGVSVERTRIILFFAVSFMLAGIITACGPIGFVGIMVPHICRLLLGPNLRHLIPASLLFGGIFLATCDTLARSLSSSTEIPVGIITALLGGPFFLILLFRSPGLRR